MPRIVIDGKTYETDDDTIAQMAKDGVKYEPAKAEGGFWQGAGDTLRGGAHGFSAGLSDAKFGDSNQSLMQRAGLADYNDVKQRSPVLSTIGDLGGSMVGPLGELGKAAQGAKMAVRVGKGMLGAGFESAVREAADEGQGASPTKVAEAGGIGSVIGGAIPLAGAAIKGIGNSGTFKGITGALGNMVEKGTDAARNRSAGIGVKDLKSISDNTGLSGNALSAKVAKDIEQLAPAPKWGQSADATHAALDAERKAQGAAIGQSLDEAGSKEGLDAFIGPSSGSPGTWAQIQQRVQGAADQLPKADDAERALYGAAQRTATGLAEEAAPKTLGAMHGRISDFGEHAYSAGKDGVQSLADDASSQASEIARKHGRDELGQLIDKYATPATADKFKDSMKGYSNVADYTKAAKNRSTIEAASSNDMTGSAVTAAAALGQGVMGSMGGLAVGGIPGAIGGGIAGFGTGVATALHSGTNNFAKQMLGGTKGQSMLANYGRHVTPKIRNADSMVQGLGDALARQGNRPGVVGLESTIAPAFVQPDMADEERQRREALGYGSR